MTSSGYIDRFLKVLGFKDTHKDWGAKRRSEERDDEFEVPKYPRITDGDIDYLRFMKSSDFGQSGSGFRTLEDSTWGSSLQGTRANLNQVTKRYSTAAMVNKHVQEGQESSRYSRLPLRRDFTAPSSSFAQEQYIRKLTDKPLFLDRNVDIEISDDEDVAYVPPPKTNNFGNFCFSGAPANGEALKSPTPMQKPIPALIPRSSVSKMRPIEKKSRFTLLSNPTSLFSRPSASGVSSDYPRLLAMRKNSQISKENRYSRSGNMVRSALKDSFNLTQKNKYQELLKRLMPSTSKSRPISLSSAQPKPKIVDTIDLVDLEFSDDELQHSTLKSSTKTSTVLQESINSLNNSKKTPVLAPINSKPMTLSSSESTSRVSTPEIEPVNSMLMMLKSNPYCQDDWLSKQAEKRSKKREESQKNIEEAEKLSKQYEAERKKEEADFFIKKMHDIAISAPPIIVEESEDEEEFVLPELTTKQIALVKLVTQRGSPSEVIVSKFNLNITRQDLCTLVGDAWLNDEVINFYMNLLTERSGKEDINLPKVYAMNTFFAVRLLQAGHAGVKRWTRKVDIFAHDVIPVPVHVSNVHWCMAIIHLKNRTIRYYDSMGQPNMRILDALEQYLKSESMDKRQRPFDMSGWEKECMADAPRQMNGSDCGVFSCMFAEYITRNSEITFTQGDMPYFRQKMIVEIATGKLLL